MSGSVGPGSGARSALALVLALPLLLCACSLDYGAEAPGELGPGTPELLLLNTVHRSVLNGRVAFRVEAARAEVHESKGYTLLLEAIFTEYAPDGSVLTEGSADRVRVDSASEDAEIEGNIVFRSVGEDTSFTTSRLAWKAKERRLVGGDDALAIVTRGDGTEIRGAGFEADAGRKTYRFDEAVAGTFAADEASQ